VEHIRCGELLRSTILNLVVVVLNAAARDKIATILARALLCYFNFILKKVTEFVTSFLIVRRLLHPGARLSNFILSAAGVEANEGARSEPCALSVKVTQLEVGSVCLLFAIVAGW